MLPRKLQSIAQKLGSRGTTPNANAARIRRRKVLATKLGNRLSHIIALLFAVGYLWMLAIPLPQLSQRIYIDENALQPGQVTTHWTWDDVHRADNYLEQLEKLRDNMSTSEERAIHITMEFKKLGIPASTQRYSYTTQTQQPVGGVNSYAVFSSPRASGSEAMVISASWLSRTGEGDGTLNLRGVATVLALAGYLKGHSLWAKDIVFVLGDGYLDGMHAWLSIYHGAHQSNLNAEPLALSSGVIWTALNLDYPGHSFSHLGVFFEGLNGRLPNQDLINSFHIVARNTGGVPVITHDHKDFQERDYVPSWVPAPLKQMTEVKEYSYRANNVIQQLGYQARGMASGAHGLYHSFRIDAITLFALPATGPHGFHALGRIVESTMRTTNNLLERLHASFFFYILTSPGTFMKVGMYLPSVILVSVAMMFGGLREWVKAGWYEEPGVIVHVSDGKTEPFDSFASQAVWRRRRRPLLLPLSVVLASHAAGAMALLLSIKFCFDKPAVLAVPVFMFTYVGAIAAMASVHVDPTSVAPAYNVLKCINLCLASTIISVTSVLNFALALGLAILLGLPLYFASPSRSRMPRTAKHLLYACLCYGWLIFLPGETQKLFLNWQVLGVWFAPFLFVVYAPLVLQAGLVSLMVP